MLKTVGQKISRIGDVLQEPRLIPLRLRGIEVRMFECLNKPWLLGSDIKTIFDVGANTGQFARAVHEVLPAAFIYSFEPLPDCFRELQVAMNGLRNFRAFNISPPACEGEENLKRHQLP